MAFDIIPAIDLRAGRAVRLYQGDYGAETVFADDPAEPARRFRDAGARRLHIVDLDGARDGRSANLQTIRDIVRECPDLAVDVGGGLRSMDGIAAVLDAGVRWAVLGTAALEDPGLVTQATERWPDRIIVGVDARDGYVTVRGWLEDSRVTASELVARLADSGVSGVIYTDVRRDGTGHGPNLDATRTLAESTELPVVASGGVGTLEHVRAAAACHAAGVSGVIVGRALYDGAFTLADALAAVR